MTGMTEPTRTHEPPTAAHPTAARAGASRWSSPVIGIGVSAISARPRVRLIVRLAELGAGVGFVLATLPPDSSKFVPGLVGGAVSGLAWLAWILCGEDRRRALVALSALSVAGGVSGAAHQTGELFVFVATAATAFSCVLPIATAVFVPGLLAFLATNLAAGSSLGHVSSIAAAGLLGIVLGVGRRQLLERDREATLLATAERRVELASREVQLAGERNRLGREIHDVVAHTLGAVSIQLTALDSRIDKGDTPEALRARVRSLRGLVADGLLELRDAVHTLRDDNLSLGSQINRLCTLHGAELRIAGRSRALQASKALALYRVVQEALTNAAKHAPGVPVTVALSYTQDEVTVIVVNKGGFAHPSPLADTGGGNGLEGMRARVALAGGHCTAGPHNGGWRVAATLPLDEHDQHGAEDS
jgi:signal transduction histidine kinase